MVIEQVLFVKKQHPLPSKETKEEIKEEEEEEIIVTKRRTPRKHLKRVRFNILQDSDEDTKESSAKKFKLRSR
jgi:hypothetical protein